mmetsp:Transcript_17714/g.40655  ORF Transcript_17714/g.40655 Transcript_17714/m.40655 type:complete len:215 (-) Transcript_17714:1642-2286(-)
MRRVHVLSGLVKTLDGTGKVDAPALAPTDGQHLAVAAPNPDLAQLDRLVSAARVRRCVFFSGPEHFDLVSEQSLVGRQLHVIHGYHEQGWQVPRSSIGIAIDKGIGGLAHGGIPDGVGHLGCGRESLLFVNEVRGTRMERYIAVAQVHSRLGTGYVGPVSGNPNHARESVDVVCGQAAQEPEAGHLTRGDPHARQLGRQCRRRGGGRQRRGHQG